MSIKFRIHLTLEERAELLGVIKTGKRKAQHIQYAHLLLGSDESGGQVATHKGELSARYRVSERMVERVRKSFCEQGMKLFEKREGRTRSDKKIDARVEAHLIALCCGPAPDGEPKWKLQLLADELVRLEVIDSFPAMSVCSLLKKTNSSLSKRSNM